MNEKMNNKYKIGYIISLVISTIIIAFLIIVINNNMFTRPVLLKETSKKVDVNYLVSINCIDTCIASNFSTEYHPQYASTLYETNIISESDKEVLKQLVNDDSHIALVFGIKDGKDVVCVCYGISKVKVFDSNLPYSFNEIISDLEKVCGKTIDLTETPRLGQHFDKLNCYEISFNINKETKKIGYTYILIDDYGVKYYYRIEK